MKSIKKYDDYKKIHEEYDSPWRKYTEVIPEHDEDFVEDREIEKEEEDDEKTSLDTDLDNIDFDSMEDAEVDSEEDVDMDIDMDVEDDDDLDIESNTENIDNGDDDSPVAKKEILPHLKVLEQDFAFVKSMMGAYIKRFSDKESFTQRDLTEIKEVKKKFKDIAEKYF